MTKINKNKTARSCALSLVLVLLLCFVIRLIWYTKYDVPYKNFKDSEATAVPLFIALNEKIYNEVHPPSGVKEIDKKEGVASVQHGVVLYITYKMENPDVDTVLNYYENLFLSKKWEKYKKNTNDNVYYHETSCVEVIAYKNDQNTYDLYIYHDYFNQPFSPTDKNIPFPPIGLYEFGESQYVRCPPFLDSP